MSAAAPQNPRPFRNLDLTHRYHAPVFPDYQVQNGNKRIRHQTDTNQREVLSITCLRHSIYPYLDKDDLTSVALIGRGWNHDVFVFKRDYTNIHWAKKLVKYISSQLAFLPEDQKKDMDERLKALSEIVFTIIRQAIHPHDLYLRIYQVRIVIARELKSAQDLKVIPIDVFQGHVSYMSNVLEVNTVLYNFEKILCLIGLYQRIDHYLASPPEERNLFASENYNLKNNHDFESAQKLSGALTPYKGKSAWPTWRNLIEKVDLDFEGVCQTIAEQSSRMRDKYLPSLLRCLVERGKIEEAHEISQRFSVKKPIAEMLDLYVKGDIKSFFERKWPQYVEQEFRELRGKKPGENIDKDLKVFGTYTLVDYFTTAMKNRGELSLLLQVMSFKELKAFIDEMHYFILAHDPGDRFRLKLKAREYIHLIKQKLKEWIPHVTLEELKEFKNSLDGYRNVFHSDTRDTYYLGDYAFLLKNLEIAQKRKAQHEQDNNNYFKYLSKFIDRGLFLEDIQEMIPQFLRDPNEIHALYHILAMKYARMGKFGKAGQVIVKMDIKSPHSDDQMKVIYLFQRIGKEVFIKKAKEPAMNKHFACFLPIIEGLNAIGDVEGARQLTQLI